MSRIFWKKYLKTHLLSAHLFGKIQYRKFGFLTKLKLSRDGFSKSRKSGGFSEKQIEHGTFFDENWEYAQSILRKILDNSRTVAPSRKNSKNSKKIKIDIRGLY